MANIRSAAKQARKSARRRILNQTAANELRQAAKKIKNLVKEGKKDEALSLLSAYQSQAAKAAKVKRLKKNTAARRVSRIARLFRVQGEAAPVAAKSTKPKVSTATRAKAKAKASAKKKASK